MNKVKIPANSDTYEFEESLFFSVTQHLSGFKKLVSTGENPLIIYLSPESL